MASRYDKCLTLGASKHTAGIMILLRPSWFISLDALSSYVIPLPFRSRARIGSFLCVVRSFVQCARTWDSLRMRCTLRKFFLHRYKVWLSKLMCAGHESAAEGNGIIIHRLIREMRFYILRSDGDKKAKRLLVLPTTRWTKAGKKKSLISTPVVCADDASLLWFLFLQASGIKKMQFPCKN